ncbi:MAG: ATP-dependent RNA helicase HrpA, partial [Deltaproteobacteria bacterium]|nr:ATP-dependent RNA helicase HrpA [Deltaproteobacteria bacterium]
PISRASADQRKGRCGRVQEGVCIRLFSEKDYLFRPAFTPPEIQRSNLAEVILRMLYLELGHPDSFPFLDRPADRSIKDGFDLLVELGAITKSGKDYALTELGRTMARMPLDPRISRMMIEAAREGCLEEVAVIAAALSIQDPRERPVEKAAQADQAHASFRDPDSDFLTLLNIWNRYHREWGDRKTQARIRRFCKDHFLSFLRMREWVYTHAQILTILSDRKLVGPPCEIADSRYDAIHRSILSGFLSNIALKKEKNIYLAARGREVMLFPGSTLFNRNLSWVVAAEMVKTSRLFARTTARIDPGWLEALGKEFCKYSYADPHWEKSRGEVRAYEQVSLFGLPIITRRPVSFGPVHPEEAHRIFIVSALVEGDVKEPLPFLVHNRKLIERLSSMEDKLRRRDILAGEAALEEFYSSRLEGVYDMATLKKAIRQGGGDRFLRLREEDLLLFRPDEEVLVQYPDRLALGEKQFDCTYKFAPGKPEDGITVRVPSGILSRLPAAGLEWGIPGLFREKVTALIKGLPKRYRKQLVPVSGTVDIILREIGEPDERLLNALAGFVYQRFGVDIPASVWSAVEIPEHLRMRVSIVDHRGRELESGRDLGILRQKEESRLPGVDSGIWQEARNKWERSGITAWDFGTLPDTLNLHEHLLAFPGLEPDEKAVNIRLFQTYEQALDSHTRGVEVLFSIHLAKDLKHLRRALTLPEEGAEGASYFGGIGALERDLFEAICMRLLRQNIRTRDAFETEAQKIRSEIPAAAKALKEQAARVLQPYHETSHAIHAMESANRKNPAVVALCGRIRKELEALVPEHFLLLYTLDRLHHMPRYLRALQIRVERGANDLEKDRNKAAQVEGFLSAHKKMTDELTPSSSREKREALEEYRWMIEEFRVSLFAQELKTPFPVSRKRMEERRRDIERMV